MPWAAGAGILAAILANNAQNRQQRMIRDQQRAAEQRYQQHYGQLSELLSGVLADDYQAISPALINQVVDQAARDIGRQQTRTNEQILRDQARRGLAGHSLIDQRQAHVDSRANQALGDARLQAEMQAQNMTAQQQAQARNLLAGVTSENFQAMNQAGQNLIGSLGNQADIYAGLAGTLAGPYLENWGSWGQQQQQQQQQQPSAQFAPLSNDRNIFNAPKFGPQVSWTN